MPFKSLELMDRIRPLFEKMGVNYPVMRKILELKLTMDSRRIPTALQNKRDAAKDDGRNQMLRSLWVYGLVSIMPGLFSIFPMPIFTKVCFIMGISMFLVMSTMISDFSSVLLDMRDKNVLLTFPIDSKTLATAKAVHIFIYLSLITLSLNLLPIIGIGYSEGLTMAFLLVFMLFLMVLSVIFLTSLLYVQVLKNFSGEKLKDIISSIQIMLTVVIALGYQLIGRLFDLSRLQFEFNPTWWSYFIPPTWFAAPFAVVNGESLAVYGPLALIGIIVPFIFLHLHLKVISPAFEQNLNKLNSNDQRAPKAYFRRNFRRKLWASLVCRTEAEKAAFGFGYNVLSTERELKQKVYPSMVLSIIFPFLLGLTSLSMADSIADALQLFRESNHFLWIYFSVLILPTLFMLVANSKNYKGAWIYRAVPMESPSELISGTYKSAIVKFGLLPFAITASFMISIYGFSIAPHMFIAFINSIYMVLVLIKLNGLSLPFSRSFQLTRDGHMKGTMLGMLCVGFLSGIHTLVTHLDSNLWLLLVLIVQLVFIGPAWRKTMQIGWNDLKV